MILSDRDIRRRLEKGDLKVEPLDDPELQIQPASIDMRLGKEFLEFERSNIPCIHPESEEETDEYTRRRIVENGEDYVLHPGDFVLGTTYETVEIPEDLVARVEGRSSLGRLAVVVHASLPYDEQVFLWTPEDGFGFHPIGEVVEGEIEARAVAFDPATLEVSTHRVTDYITNPTKDIYRVTLESGREVRVTEDHNLFTLDEAGRVTRVPSEESEGELVMVPDELPEPVASEEDINLVSLLSDEDDELVAYASDGSGTLNADWDTVPRGSRRHYEERGAAPLRAIEKPSEVEIAYKQSDYRIPETLDVTEEFAWVLGFYVAERYARRKHVVFTNTDDALLERVADWFDGHDASLSWSKSGGASRLTVCSTLWSSVFAALSGKGDEKDVPDVAWNWSDEKVAAFLEGLVDGDGSRRETRTVLYTFNESLADNVAYLCSRLGLRNTLRSRERETGTEWTVEFAEDAHRRGEYVPAVPELLREARAETDMRMSDVADAVGWSSKSSVSNLENAEYDAVKRGTLERLRGVYADDDSKAARRLSALLDGGVRFERVEAVENTGRSETTYDLEVQPDGRAVENFVGGRGGVFLSNTAGFVDPGYRGQITLELSNLGTAPVALRPEEMRISQLVLTELSSPAEEPYGEERGSKYQDQDGPTASRIGEDAEWKKEEREDGNETQ